MIKSDNELKLKRAIAFITPKDPPKLPLLLAMIFVNSESDSYIKDIYNYDF